MRKNQCFTMGELLLVIAAVVVMAGVLVPVLNAAGEEAAAKSCTANLKKIMISAASYSSDNQGTLCPIRNYTIVNGQQKFGKTYWTQLLATYLGEPKLKTTGYRDPAGVLTCPDFGERKPFKGYPEKMVFEAGRPDYGMNAYGPGQTRGMGTQIEKLAQVRKPAEMIYFADSFTKDFGGMNGSNTILSYAYVAFRHDKKANFGYVDGHVAPRTPDEVHYKGKDAGKRLPWSQLWN